MRPMVAADVPVVDAIAEAAFADLGVRRGRPDGPRSDADAARNLARVEHLLVTDPEGCWVTEAPTGEVTGVAIALLREGVWGLSMLAVAPEHQSSGAGRLLMDRVVEYERGARGSIILASDDHRAIRTYSRAGFRLVPALGAFGAVKRGAIPKLASVRAGDDVDLDLVAAIDRELRGAAHGLDIDVMRAHGSELLIVEDRGYALHRGGTVMLLGARDPSAARDLLWASLAGSEPGAEVVAMFLTGDQDWAWDVLVAAGLQIEPSGPVCVRGELGTLAPYIPNGSYL